MRNSWLITLGVVFLLVVFVLPPSLLLGNDSEFLREIRLFSALSILLLLGAFLLVKYFGWWGGPIRWRPDEFAAKNAQPPPWYAQFLVLLVALFCIVLRLADAASSSPQGTIWVKPGDVPPDLASAYTSTLVVTGIVIVLTVTVALLGKARTAVILLFLTGPCYQDLPYNHGLLYGQQQRDEAQSPRVSYAITLDLPAKGAELWVNGVALGEFPVTMTASEFDEKTHPQRRGTQAPEAGSGSPQPQAGTEFKRPTFIPGILYDEYHPWNKKPSEVYFAQVKLGDEWGEPVGSYENGGHERNYQTTLHFRFPEREARFEALLNEARAHNYQVGPEWTDSLLSYGNQGWRTAHLAAAEEPGFRILLDECAKSHYGLDTLDETTAWQVFERICDEADAEGSYDSLSVAGQAVAILAPHLKPGRLAKRAEKLLAQYLSISIEWETLTGELHFRSPAGNQYEFDRRGYDERQDGTLTAGSYSHYGWSPPYPPHACVTMDALRRVVTALRSNSDPRAHEIEDRVTRSLLCWESGNDLAMISAVWLGGTDLPTYLLRSKWQEPVRTEWTFSQSDNDTSLPGIPVNRWLYFLAHLKGEEGAQFREAHQQEVLNLAETIASQRVFDPDIQGRGLAFLFLDSGRADENLAQRFWPTFQRNYSDSVEAQRWYLSQMESMQNSELDEKH